VAAGDAHRVWFPEMVEHLRLRWRDDLSMEALLGLRDELDDMLGAFARRGTSPARSSSVPRAATSDVAPIPTSVFAPRYLAAGRFGVVAREPVRALEKAWSAYRKTAGLDLYGHAATSERALLPGRAHADER
jgi:hypothetical protein